MRKAPVFVLVMVGLAYVGPAAAENITIQMKGAY
jgi:hypothetical protein